MWNCVVEGPQQPLPGEDHLSLFHVRGPQCRGKRSVHVGYFVSSGGGCVHGHSDHVPTHVETVALTSVSDVLDRGRQKTSELFTAAT